MTLPKPYYEDSAVTIYCGDSNELLSAGASAGWCGGPDAISLVLTDPPYGVKGEQNTKSANRLCGRKNAYGTFTDSLEYVSRSVLPVIRNCIAWFRTVIVTPGNFALCMYPNPVSFGCFYQPASVGLQPFGRADSQPILYYGKSPHAGIGLPSQSCSFVLTESPERNGHPCPKPQIAWQKLVCSGSQLGETILDPFMGSGTTLRAAKDLGRKAIGIEIEEKYCEIAALRMAQEVFAL